MYWLCLWKLVKITNVETDILINEKIVQYYEMFVQYYEMFVHHTNKILSS